MADEAGKTGAGKTLDVLVLLSVDSEVRNWSEAFTRLNIRAMGIKLSSIKDIDSFGQLLDLQKPKTALATSDVLKKNGEYLQTIQKLCSYFEKQRAIERPILFLYYNTDQDAVEQMKDLKLYKTAIPPSPTQETIEQVIKNDYRKMTTSMGIPIEALEKSATAPIAAAAAAPAKPVYHEKDFKAHYSAQDHALQLIGPVTGHVTSTIRDRILESAAKKDIDTNNKGVLTIELKHVTYFSVEQAREMGKVLKDLIDEKKLSGLYFKSLNETVMTECVGDATLMDFYRNHVKK